VFVLLSFGPLSYGLNGECSCACMPMRKYVRMPYAIFMCVCMSILYVSVCMYV
jgi:hypothetical protein